MRTVGVEEELLLVRSGSGQAVSVAPRVLRRADLAEGDRPADGRPGHPTAEAGSSLDGELQRQQLETDTAPHRSMDDLGAELVAWREHAEAAARREGARVAALGTSPLPVEPRTGRSERYREIVERFGLVGSEQLTCGCHVHVGVDSPDEAVAALDRVRVWLPTFLALSANSPYWQGSDSGYASYRAQVMGRWPTAGPPDAFGTAAAYRQRIRDLLATGVIMDEGMVYLDARPSATYPTLEIRVADVCQDPRDTVLLAALSRALVQTAAADWRAGRPAPDVPTALLRAATWQASCYGLGDGLVHPDTGRLRPASEVLTDLVERVRPALEEYGDVGLVAAGLDRLARTGNGADRQRRELERTGSLPDVVAAAVRTTHGLEDAAVGGSRTEGDPR